MPRSTLTTAGVAIIELLAAEERRVLSDWRALLLLRRATDSIPPHTRRWTHKPRNINEIHPILNQMHSRGQIEPIPSLKHVYEVTVPYARAGLVEEDEILMEVHPYASLSYLSALTFHNLTNELPKEIAAMIPSDGIGGQLPLGTGSEDWKELALAPGRTPARISNQPVRWVRTKIDWYFGMDQYRPRGYPVRVTSPERTLLDGLRQPELCGGLENVLRAWSLAQDTLELDKVVAYVDRFNIRVLRQRVGFILDELHLSHPRLEKWRAESQRGGSSKLLGSAPYAPRYSESWNLSLNAPTSPLHKGAA